MPGKLPLFGWFFGLICFLELGIRLFVFTDRVLAFYPLAFALPAAALFTLLCGFGSEKAARRMTLFLTLLTTVYYGTQLVYYYIFKNFLSIYSVQMGLGQVLQFWPTALRGILVNLPGLCLFLSPPCSICFCCAGRSASPPATGGGRGHSRSAGRSAMPPCSSCSAPRGRRCSPPTISISSAMPASISRWTSWGCSPPSRSICARWERMRRRRCSSWIPNPIRCSRANRCPPPIRWPSRKRRRPRRRPAAMAIRCHVPTPSPSISTRWKGRRTIPSLPSCTAISPSSIRRCRTTTPACSRATTSSFSPPKASPPMSSTPSAPHPPPDGDRGVLLSKLLQPRLGGQHLGRRICRAHQPHSQIGRLEHVPVERQRHALHPRQSALGGGLCHLRLPQQHRPLLPPGCLPSQPRLHLQGARHGARHHPHLAAVRPRDDRAVAARFRRGRPPSTSTI